MCLCPPQALTN